MNGGLGDSIGGAFDQLGSSIGNLFGSMQAAGGEWFNQAANTILASVPLIIAGAVMLALFVLWFLRRAVG